MESVELLPRPGLLIESLCSFGYSLETALADVIDNSLTAEANTISVRFLWAGGPPWLAVMMTVSGKPKEVPTPPWAIAGNSLVQE